MAYPIQRHSSFPQTPQYLKGIHDAPQGIDTPPRSLRRMRPHLPSLRNGVVTLFTLLILGLILRTRFKGTTDQLDRLPYSAEGTVDYFRNFEGRQDCGISSQDVYVAPSTTGHDGNSIKKYPFCKNRAGLLEAMSGGGRHGFDAPFFPKGCHYRWYSTPEICMILERFDGLIFIGDDMVRNIYVALNILLRENVALGGLRQWDMDEAERSTCRCENQFIKPECLRFAVSNNDEVRKNDAKGGHPSPYHCDRIPHMYLPTTGTPAPESHHQAVKDLLARSPDSWRPIPIIHSLSLSTGLSWPTATASMEEWLSLIDSFVETSLRNTPTLWLGPVAAGHLKPPGLILSQGNNALWHYTLEMSKEAKTREMETLGMYNLTMQATSWDGSSYGEKVAMVQAMMEKVINWLSRLETT
ncbi:MAG: hypothetical protein M1823_003717 [Watsoniomyces obsoletus]|nr:MAG: hypothetical protein M1823_003717 [Watsoniomyces obsoletus]